MTMTKYRVFKRRPWKRNPAWPNGWEPHGGARKITVERSVDYDTAVDICTAANAGKIRKPGQIYYEFEAI